MRTGRRGRPHARAPRQVTTPQSTCSAATVAPDGVFVGGTLVAVTQDSFSVDTGMTYSIGPGTQICRNGCSAPWSEMQVGDRVQAWVDANSPARWINVNPWADQAQIDAID